MSEVRASIARRLRKAADALAPPVVVHSAPGPVSAEPADAMRQTLRRQAALGLFS